ncbi:MAG: hypothetical protein EXS37_20465 [Opitutus sp.]|nr:hypothetical protein [Opitutus sp.]
MSEPGEIVRFEAPLKIHGPTGEAANTWNGLPMIELPDDDRTGGDFAAELGKHLARADIFRRGKILMTLTGKRDRLEPVGDHELRTLVERYVCLFRARVPKKTGEQLLKIRITLGIDAARMTMNSPQLLAEIREVEHLHDIPLPVQRPDGSLAILAEGYDASSRTLTLRACDYVSRPNPNGATFLRELLSEFQFNEPERALAVAVSAMLTLFARRLLPPLAHRPAFIYLSNAAGGGKTLLADCSIAPVFGRSPRTPFPRREEELEKLLLAEVLCGCDCLLFDNVRGRVESASIENLLTSHIFKGRILNQSKTYEGENHLVMFFTGNAVTVSEDLARRALFVELFQPEARAQDRQFKNPLSVGLLVERRAEVLAALWQIVQAWHAAGRPRGRKSHASFPEWATLIGGIVEHAGFASPVTAPALHDGGNQDVEDMVSLVAAVRDAHCDRPIDFEKLADLAGELGLFERITEGVGASGLDRADKAKLGKLLKGYDRRVFGETRLTFLVEGRGHGRRFRISLPGVAARGEGVSR